MKNKYLKCNKLYKESYMKQFINVQDLVENIENGTLGVTGAGELGYKSKTGMMTYTFSNDDKMIELIKDLSLEQIRKELEKYQEESNTTASDNFNAFMSGFIDIKNNNQNNVLQEDQDNNEVISADKNLLKLNSNEVSWDPQLNGFTTNKLGVYNTNSDATEITNNLFIPEGYNQEQYQKIDKDKVAQLVRLDQDGKFIYFVSHITEDGTYDLQETFIVNNDGSLQTSQFELLTDSKDLFVKVAGIDYNLTEHKDILHSDLIDVSSDLSMHINAKTSNFLNNLINLFDQSEDGEFIRTNEDGDIVRSNVKEQFGVLFADDWLVSNKSINLRYNDNKITLDNENSEIEIINKDGKKLILSNRDGDLRVNGNISANSFNGIEFGTVIKDIEYNRDQLKIFEESISTKIDNIKQQLVEEAQKVELVKPQEIVKVDPITISEFSSLELTAENQLNFNFNKQDFEVVDGMLRLKESISVDDFNNAIKGIKSSITKTNNKIPLKKQGDKNFFVDGNITTSETPTKDNQLTPLGLVRQIAKEEAIRQSGGTAGYDAGGSSSWGNITGDINNQTDLQGQFNNYINKDGSTQVDNTFTPTNDYDIVFKKYIDDLISGISSKSSQSYNYSLDIAAPAFAEIHAGGTNDGTLIDTGWKMLRDGIISQATVKFNNSHSQNRLCIYKNETGDITQGIIPPTKISTNHSNGEKTVIYDFDNISVLKGDTIRVNLDGWSNNPSVIIMLT